MKIKRMTESQIELPAVECEIEPYEGYVCMNFNHDYEDDTLMLSYQDVLKIMNAAISNQIEEIDKEAEK